jgi:hypothetical protein
MILGWSIPESDSFCLPFCAFDDYGRVAGPEVPMPARFQVSRGLRYE